jgi:hypothetical protein
MISMLMMRRKVTSQKYFCCWQVIHRAMRRKAESGLRAFTASVSGLPIFRGLAMI